MNSYIKITFLLALILLLPDMLFSQSSRIRTGEQVRIKTIYSGKPVIGSVMDLDYAGLFVYSDHGEFLFMHSDIRTLWVRREGKRNVGRGFMIGALSGGTLSGIISTATWDGCTQYGMFGGCVGPSSKGEAFFWGAIDGVVVGGLMGAAIGYYTKTERWVKIKRHNLVLSSQITAIAPNAPPALTLQITLLNS
jgi:hypothetical protein